MRRFSISILFLLFLVCAASSVAQEAIPNPANPRFPVIQASLDDGFYTLAEQQARGILLSEPGQEDANDAILLLAHALWGQKRYSEILALLLDADSGAGVAYWRARACFELRQYDEGLNALATGGSLPSDSIYRPASLRLKGRMEQLSGKLAEAEKTYKQYAASYSGLVDAVDNQLDLADVYIAQERLPDAEAVYETLAAGEDKRGSQLGRLKLAHLLYTTGSGEDVAKARTLLAALSSDGEVRTAYRIDAFIDLAALEEKVGRLKESVSAMRSGIALSPDARQRVTLKLSLVKMLLRSNDVDGALKLLEECRTEAPDGRVAAELQLEKAGALMRAERYQEADDAYQVYLDVADDPDGLAQAYFGKGLALWGLERYSESAMLFDKAQDALYSPEEKANALFKAGDAYYQAGMLDEAEKRYRTFIVDYPGNRSMANVLYQLGLVLAKIGRRAEALTTFEIIESSHPDSPFAEKAALRAADVMLASGQWEEALGKYTAISQTYTNSTEAELSLHQRGLVLYKLGKHVDALKIFDAVLADYPDSSLAPQAFYMRGFCLYQLGQVDEAIQTCRSFIDQYPDSMWTSDVVFWLAEHYYNQGNYEQAQDLFMRIADRFKDHRLAPRALYWAGRAASAESDYVTAIERYSKVAKDYPDTDILPQVRFAQGDALSEIGEFAKAILAFEEIIKKYPESELVNAAWGRKGNCQFSLAVDAPSRYEEAISSYQAILDRPTASPVLKMEAENAIGRCLEKLGRYDKAFSRYMNVVYSFRNVERTPYSVVWFTRSAIAAAALKENVQAWKDAVQVYERVIEADVPAKDEALKRIEKIKNANWLLFQQAGETGNTDSP